MRKNAFDGADQNRLVTVLETRDFAFIAIARSLLEEAGIDFWTKGEALLLTVPNVDLVEFQVRAEDADLAKKILSEVEG